MSMKGRPEGEDRNAQHAGRPLSGNDGRDTAPPPAVSCADCAACCCRLEVLLMDDDVPSWLTGRDRWGGTVMRRLADGWCAALDRNTLRCTIYARRPALCRAFAVGDHACLEERARR